MPYTLWSRGRLLGHSELDFIYRENGFRCGFFQPADGVDALIDIATGVSSAVFALSDNMDDPTAHADLAAAIAHCNSLDLELRGPDGEVIACEDICIRDTQVLIARADMIDDDDDGWYESLDDEARAAFDAAVEHDRALIDEWFAEEEYAPWEPEVELPRYQLQIQLVDRSPG